MRRLTLSFFLLSLVTLLTVPASISARDRAHQLANYAHKLKAVTCGEANAQSMEDRRRNYPTGCSDALKPKCDLFLGFPKNQMPHPSIKPLRNLTPVDFRYLERQIPHDITAGGLEKHALHLADHGEGNVCPAVGRLYYWQFTRGPEACNCKLTGESNSD